MPGIIKLRRPLIGDGRKFHAKDLHLSLRNGVAVELIATPNEMSMRFHEKLVAKMLPILSYRLADCTFELRD